MINKSSSPSEKIEKNANQKSIKPISFLLGFVAISGLIAFLIGGFMIGKN